MNSTAIGFMVPSDYHDKNYTIFEIESELLIEKLSKGLAYCLLFIVSMVGNILILWAIYRDNRLKTNVNILVSNMTISDILASLVRIPIETVYVINQKKWAIGGKAGAVLCKFTSFHFDLCFAVSVYSCLLIAIDRYYAVAYPFRGGRFSRSRLKFIILGIWIFAGIICLPSLYSVDLTKSNENFYCFEDLSENNQVHWSRQYFYIFVLFSNGIPFFVVAGIYVMTMVKLHVHVQGQERLMRSDALRRKKELQNKKILKMHLFIISFLFLSLIVHKTFLVLFVTGRLDNLSSSVFSKMDFIANYIFHVFVVYNFFVYLVFNNIYRQNFKAAFSKCFRVNLVKLLNGGNSSTVRNRAGASSELNRLSCPSLPRVNQPSSRMDTREQSFASAMR